VESKKAGPGEKKEENLEGKQFKGKRKPPTRYYPLRGVKKITGKQKKRIASGQRGETRGKMKRGYYGEKMQRNEPEGTEKRNNGLGD